VGLPAHLFSSYCNHLEAKDASSGRYGGPGHVEWPQCYVCDDIRYFQLALGISLYPFRKARKIEAAIFYMVAIVAMDKAQMQATVAAPTSR
jgi:hypothetical protein